MESAEEQERLATRYLFHTSPNKMPEQPAESEVSISEEIQALNRPDKQLATPPAPSERPEIYDQQAAVLRQLAEKSKTLV